MYLKTVCRLCLATDAPMHNIADSPMQNIYEKLTHISLSMEHRPVVACHICYYQLRKCYELMVRSVRADKVLTQIIQSGEVETENSTAVLIREAHQHTLSLTPIKIITIMGTDHNSVKSEIKEEPMSPQCIKESETDRPPFSKHLKLEESEDNEDMNGEFMTDVDNENQTSTDHRHLEQESDLLYVCVPVEYIKTEEMADGRDIKSDGAENVNMGEYEGATTSDKCEQTPAENKEHLFNLTPEGKNIPEKLTTLESKTIKEMKTRKRTGGTYTLHRNKNDFRNRQVSTNTSMCSDTATNKANITVDQPFECEICKVRFSQKGNLNIHLRTHTGEKPFECEICKVRFSNKSYLKIHLRTHTGAKPFECEICKVRFNQKDNLKTHMRKHTGEKPFVCEICKVKFSDKSNLNRHLQKHMGEKFFECEICKVRFSQKGNLNIHLRKHTGEKIFECNICKIRFSQKGNLNIHLRKHTGDKPFECEICKVRFSHKGNLNIHMRKHTGERPFECEICKIKFSLKSSLKKHLRTHAGMNSFECHICRLRFSQQDSLNAHLSKHTEEKPFECEICKVRFSRKDHLNRHLRKHTGEKPFECEICKVRFSQKGHLNRHLRKHTD